MDIQTTTELTKINGMDIQTASEFTKINGVNSFEKFGNIELAIEPGSFCIFDKNSPSNGLHYHNIYEICLVTGGSGEFLHGGELYFLNAGDVFIANPGLSHEIRLAKSKKGEYEGNLYLIFFQFKIIAKKNALSVNFEGKMLNQFIQHHEIICKAQVHLFAYLSFIRDYITGSQKNTYWLCQITRNFCLECIYILVDFENYNLKESNTSKKIIEMAIDYISANINRRIYITEIASNVNYSKRNLQLVFKMQFKKTITEYINEHKTALAAGYLKMNFKVSEVSNILGINDSAQFSRLFKKYYGMSPKKYQSTYSSIE